MSNQLPIAGMNQEVEKLTPNSVLTAKIVKLALITYVNEWGEQVTQLGIIGDENIQMLESATLGFSKTKTPVGLATHWLRDGVFNLLGIVKKTLIKKVEK